MQGIERLHGRPAALLLLLAALVAVAAWIPAAAHAVTFAGPTYSVGVAPQSVEVHDFGGNSSLDLLVANEAPHTSLASISVLLGAGDGTFTRLPDIPFGSRRPTSTAVDDFNGDSKLDFAAANYQSNDVAVLLGAGDGTFTGPTNFALAPGSAPVSIATADFNEDNQPDLVVANEATNNISVLLGVGDGTFTGPTNFPLLTSSGPQSVVVGQFDGGSHVDLAVADKPFNRVLVLLGAGDGTFTGPTPFGVGVDPTALVVDEFNGDSDPDLASANESSHNVSVLVGSTGGTFSAPANSTFAAGSIPDAVAAGNLNGDSEPDLAVANQLSDNVSVLIGGPTWSFTGPANFPAGDGSTAVAIDNFNGDSWRDLAVTAEISNTVSILLATPPDTTINSGPTLPTNNSPPPTFTFSSNDSSSTFRCRVDGNAFSSCTSPHTPTAEPHGTHTFEVRATDDAGRTDPSPAAWSFTVDTQAPTVPTNLTANAPSATRVDLIWNASSDSSGVTAYEVYRDGALHATATGTSYSDTTAIPATTHTYKVRALDTPGNRSSFGNTATVTTPSPPPPPPPPPPPVPPPAGPSPGGILAPPRAVTLDTSAPVMTVAGKTVAMDPSGVVPAPLACPASEPGGCVGTLALQTLGKVQVGGVARKRKVKLGGGSFGIAGGKSMVVKLRLSRKNRRLVTKLAKVRVLLIITARDQARNTLTTEKVLTLKGPKSGRSR